ncbi:MAG TPA: 50S ribosomal protein L21 [Candidatus Dormibacteraeota bacterium]|nr:50S ribosomal protein L21 [Candidatus Dormibacteraeota bacterium]
MKKAVISTGSKQYLVSEGDSLEIELLNHDEKNIKIDFSPLLIMDDKVTLVGEPEVKNAIVHAEIIESNVKADKVTAIRYKAKKRVHKVHGHRQQHTVIKIIKIS